MEEKVFDKIQPPFMIRTLINWGIEGNLLNFIKDSYGKPTGNSIRNGEILTACHLRLGTRQGYLLFLPPFSNVLEVLARAVRQEKIHGYWGERK